MIDAVWMVRFVMLDGARFDYGGGVVTFDAGKVTGGDSGAFYVGHYVLKGDQLDVKIRVGFHDPAVPSVFGPGFSEYTLLGRGRVSADNATIELAAAPDRAPERSLVARLFRVAELP
jgi:hypothetical protein